MNFYLAHSFINTIILQYYKYWT